MDGLSLSFSDQQPLRALWEIWKIGDREDDGHAIAQ